jgi:hypothetical protein
MAKSSVGATPSYALRVALRAWQTTVADLGLQNRRRVIIKVFWLAVALVVMWIFGLNQLFELLPVRWTRS